MRLGHLGYLETAHVRDFMAALRVVINPADEVSWFRLLTRHQWLGKASAMKLARMLADGGFDGAGEVIAAAPAKARTGLQTTLSLLGATSLTDGAAAVSEACHGALEPLLRQHYPDWQRRVTDVAGVVSAAAQQRDLRTFVSDQAIDPTAVAGDWADKPHLDEDWVTLSTVHSAKGLEWDSVHVLRASDGAFPSDMALTSNEGLAEEQRLFYVAMTRARDALHVYAPATLPTHPTSFTARHVMAKPSRFLTDAALACMDEVHTHDRPAQGAVDRSTGPAVARIHVDTMEDLFA